MGPQRTVRKRTGERGSRVVPVIEGTDGRATEQIRPAEQDRTAMQVRPAEQGRAAMQVRRADSSPIDEPDQS